MPGRLPLYRSRNAFPEELPKGGNAGLYFDKFCDTWHAEKEGAGNWSMQSDTPVEGRENRKHDFLKKVTGKAGDRALLEEHGRRLASLALARGGDFAVFRSTSRFVTGLGRSHPIENGFAWHPTLGTPYLPGSSVKGLLRAWARSAAEGAETVDDLFGPDGQVRAAGRIVFLDAVPLAPVRLEVDVMTPHYGGWTPTDPPGDWRSPNPIPFLTVAQGARFVFGWLPRPGGGGADLQRVETWLGEALAYAGAGAKTNAGYGRFERATTEEEALRADVRRRLLDRAAASGSLEAKWEREIQGKTEQELLELALKKIEKGGLADPEERRALARALMKTEFFARWKQGKAPHLGKKKLRTRVNAILEAAQADPS